MELQVQYWHILSERGFFRTAMEEEKRFQTAEPISSLQGDFARAMDRLLRRALASCSQTNNTTLKFVNAGSLSPDSHYAEDQDLLKVHAKWLTMHEAFAELGLANERTRMHDVLLITMRKLLTDIMLQIPSSRFRDHENKQSAWYRSQVISRCDERLLECVRFERDLEFITTRSEGHDSLIVKWNSRSAWAPRSEKICIQAHRVSTCSHLKNCRLIATQGILPSYA